VLFKIQNDELKMILNNNEKNLVLRFVVLITHIIIRIKYEHEYE